MGKESLDAVIKMIPQTVINRNMEQFQRDRYQNSLKTYIEENTETFRLLQDLCDQDPSRTEEALQVACSAVLDAIETDLSQKKYRRLNSRALQLDTYKMVIVTYLTPAVFKMELPVSERFNEMLQKEWQKRYPKQPYQIATEEMVMAGFRTKWYQAFLR